MGRKAIELTEEEIAEIIETIKHDDGDGPEDVFDPIEIRLGDDE